ncbi:MAG: hypothetical protein UH963_12385 [Agathobacter sp.]|nr:hypothetical protein [Agathobacter sp.]
MGLFGPKLNYSAATTGTIVGMLAVKVNNRHLPIAEYFVDGVRYEVRVPHDIVVSMEKASTGERQVVRANLNFGNTSFNGQVTGIMGCTVQVAYDPSKPQKGKVVGF